MRREKTSRAAFAFIFVTVLLDMLALGIIIPVLPRLVVMLHREERRYLRAILPRSIS